MRAMGYFMLIGGVILLTVISYTTSKQKEWLIQRESYSTNLSEQLHVQQERSELESNKNTTTIISWGLMIVGTVFVMVGTALKKGQQQTSIADEKKT